MRQLRLRDLGGIIVLDFIDMEEKKNRQKVFQTLEQELRRDRAPTQGDPGLRLRADHHHPQAREAEPRAPDDRHVPVLLGHRHDQVQRDRLPGHPDEMRKVGNDLDGHGVLLRVNPEIAEALQGDERGVLREVEQVVGRNITVRPDATCTTSSSTSWPSDEAARALRPDGHAIRLRRQPSAAASGVDVMAV